MKLLGIPFDANSSFLRGAARGPQAIRQALHDGSSNYLSQSGKDLSTAPEWQDAGDIHFPSQDAEAAFHLIVEKVSDLLARGEKILSLGGDHSITYPIIHAYSLHYPDLHILQIDAHPDLYHDFEGNPFSHASPFARIMENELAGSLTQIGIRTLNDHHKEQADKFGVRVIKMKEHDFLEPLELQAPLYISLDLDALDPAFAPGVSHHDPGGFTSREIFKIIEQIEVPVIGADIVELNPDRDIAGITARLGAGLVKELSAKLL